jgi:hypothetical protein
VALFGQKLGERDMDGAVIISNKNNHGLVPGLVWVRCYQ